MLRSALESITRGWRYERTIRVGGVRVPITVSPSAGLRYLVKPLSRIDPLLVAQARDFVRPGDVVWDVGANVGLFAFCAAALAGPSGRVVAFEPDEWLAQTLLRSAGRQPPSCAPVDVVTAAVAGKTGQRRLHLARRSRSANFLAEYESLVPFITGGTIEMRTVDATTLDRASGEWPAPNLVKIDVEGAELEALQGATQLLRRQRPVVLCEVFGHASEEVTRLFRHHRYRIFDAVTRLEVPAATWSTISIPSESDRTATG